MIKTKIEIDTRDLFFSNQERSNQTNICMKSAQWDLATLSQTGGCTCYTDIV